MSVLRKLLILAVPFFVAACDAKEETAEVATAIAVEAETPVPTSDLAAIEDPMTETLDEVMLTERIEKVGVEVISIAPTEINGLFEVDTTGGMIYASATGEQFISGTLFALDDNGTFVDVLAERQAPLNAAKIEQRIDDMIVYPADDEKYVVTVFTDTTCGYCVKLHHQMAGYNELGITVRYLAYPRQGPTGQVAEEMARIWCAEDSAKAMTQSKSGRPFTDDVENLAQCQQSIIEQYSLGRELGISGTPAVFLPNGKLLAGYMPPAGMYQRIQQEMAQ